MDQKRGLTTIQAQVLLKQSGLNILPEKPATSDWMILFRQLQSPLIYILFIAALISFFLKDITDAGIILLAVVVNTVLGFYQERKAQRGLIALKQILTPLAKVIRDSQIQTLDARTIVPGDIVILSSGDHVPADGILFEAAELTINEAILTGESIPVLKKAAPENKWESAELHAEHSAFMGTTVQRGIGKLLVRATGIKTEIGKIATSLSEAEEEPIPLQKRLSNLARVLTIVVAFSAGLIFVLGLVRGESWTEIFTTSVAVAVAAIPEGLVIALTSILALGMQRILKRKALVRKLVVAETLGTVTVIATDKTGTLTEGKLQVVKTDFTDKIEGLRAATFANHLLDPLELALWEWLTARPKFDPEALVKENPRSYMLPFDSDRKFSATAYEHVIYLLGAPEVLLQRSSLTPTQKKKEAAKVETWAREGLRVLALASKSDAHEKTLASLQKHKDIDQVTFLGIVGFADPIRASVKDALALCREAGIQVKIVTGDYRWTAQSILTQLGIKITRPEKEILEGEEMTHLPIEELVKRVEDILLFARVTPHQKLAIVEALKQKGEVVAILGDGVNDAPALKRADIGVVVGEATDVARETADLILLDSNFATIVAAIEEGRAIFANIQKVMTYLLGDTFAEVTLIFLGLVFGVPLPLTAAQILWINLVTDTLPTLALTLEPKEKHLLKRPPISPTLPILSKSIVAFMLVASLTSGIIIFGVYMYLLMQFNDVRTARLVVFTAFSIKSLFFVFSLRDRNRMVWQIPFFSNPWLIMAVLISLCLQLVGLYTPYLQTALETRHLTWSEWVIVFFSSLSIVLVIELTKYARRIIRK